MEILLIYEAKDELEKRTLSAINQILSKFKYHIVAISRQQNHSTIYEQFSLVLIYNVILSQAALKRIEMAQVPKILLFNTSKIYHSFITHPTKYDKIVLLKDNGLKDSYYIPKELVEFINYPFCSNKEEPATCRSNKSQKILIAFNSVYDNELLIRLARVINSLPQYHIMIITNHKHILNLFNKNALVLRWSDFDSAFNESDLVIGNNYIALEAIVSGKPVIVVGDNGFAGFIKPPLIERQYSTFFSGRIGGEIGERIPVSLLIDDILNVLESNEEETRTILKENASFMERQVEENGANLNRIILKLTSDYSRLKKDLLGCQLKVSTDFQLTFFRNNEYIVSMLNTNNVHGFLDKQSIEIIDQFKGGNKVLTVMMGIGSIYKEESFISLIKVLVNEKILLLQ